MFQDGNWLDSKQVTNGEADVITNGGAHMIMAISKPPKTLQQMAAETAKIEGGSRGIACPVCGCRDWRVRKTKPHDGEISRRRVCRHCGHRITTSEVSVS